MNENWTRKVAETGRVLDKTVWSEQKLDEKWKRVDENVQEFDDNGRELDEY